LPYCQGSIVTKTSKPAPDGKTYPEEAKLLIGFNNDVSEAFTSRVYCVPEQVVEAVSGQAETTLSAEEIAHHSARPQNVEEDPSRKDTVLQHLLTRWILRPFPYKPAPLSAMTPETTHKNHEETADLPSTHKTEVNLTIDYRFSNPVYGALSSAAAPRVADKMIEAFEKRVKSVVEGPASVNNKRVGEGIIDAK
jgi:coenzyme Q-binding protein COQ10